MSTSNATLDPSKSHLALSLDLDDKWSYMMTHGDVRWRDYPSYLDLFMPRVIEILNSHAVKATFFIVGTDAARKENRDLFAMIAENGHDVGNHSLNHEVWLHMSGQETITRDILTAQDYIRTATGLEPIGFRGPGFVWSRDLIQVLARNGFTYDASSLPSFLNSLSKSLFLYHTKFSPEELEKRRHIFGTFRDGFRPVKPYFIPLSDGSRMLEVPVSTIPITRTPFHMSYLLYLANHSVPGMIAYLRYALLMCRLARVQPSFLLHPLDMLSGHEVTELSFFPGMNMKLEIKLGVFDSVFYEIKQHFAIVSLNQFVRLLGEVH